jgi:hypothetical protein
MRTQLRERECPHGALFDTGDRGCRFCEMADDCRWLYDNEEFTSLSGRDGQALIAALEYAVDYVSAIPVSQGHDIDHCLCEACDWLRRAGSLLETVSPSGQRG